MPFLPHIVKPRIISIKIYFLIYCIRERKQKRNGLYFNIIYINIFTKIYFENC